MGAADVSRSSGAQVPQQVPRESSDSSYEFPVVGIGASAGGLESLEELFARMPRDSGMAFVVVQHLSPDFKSVMDELLARRTAIPIRQAEDGLPITADTIFLIPPKKEAILADGRFRLRDKEPKELTLPIDHFFRSLAQEARCRAVAVVLSGSGSDGSRGIREVHAAGGLVVSESQETAKFDGMPLSARETGVVDLVLPPSEIPEAILRHVRLPSSGDPPGKRRGEEEPTEEGVELIFGLLQGEYGIDFSHYKASTVGRRIQRRLAMWQFGSLNEYAEHLRGDSEELNALYRDLLIGVTRFFRDTEAFEKLERTVVPAIIDAVPPGDEIRVWVAGCATGEEAYSLAILFHERLERVRRPLSVKIFATDVHNASLEVAGAGHYQAEALREVSEARLRKYFNRTREGYSVDADLRRTIVFAPHNILKDAPFTKLDMIACRNLLIYFQPLAQKKALSLFHFGLKTGGVLTLGPSESPGELFDEFEALDDHWKIFRKRRDIRLPADLRYPLARGPLPTRQPVTSSDSPPARGLPDAGLLGAYDWLLARHMPPGVLIDERHQLLHIFGEAEKYLRFRGGRPTGDALDLLDDALRTVVTGAVGRAKKNLLPVRYSGVRVDGERATFDIGVEPIKNSRTSSRQFLITIEPSGDNGVAVVSDAAEQEREESTRQLSQDRINSLEHELRFTKENLQATVEELETANEELQATNEELVASNEELQSTNEELHSVNEELYTVNAEYQKKIHDLTEMTADLDSLMESTDVATVFLDRELRIRKFTPQIGSVFKLMPQDAGRCIDGFSHQIERPQLIEDMRRVLRTGEPLEEEIQDRGGRWLYLRVLPYRSKRQGHVEGVVLTLIDIDSLKRAQQMLADALRDRESFLAMLSHELRNPISAVLSASHLLASGGKEEKARKQAVSVIRRQSEHMARLLDDLLDISRMTQNKLRLRKRRIDLREVVREAVETMEPSLRERHQVLHAELTGPPIPVHGDPDRLRQVVVNLLGNSVKYSPRGGAIEVELVRRDGWATIQVRDQGDGIAPEMLPRIFEPFVQSERARGHREGGMGVGLSLVKLIAERHGGHVEASSEGMGLGSVFTFRIPCGERAAGGATPSRPARDQPHLPAEDKPGGGAERPEQPGTAGSIRKIVIVEDQRDNREILKTLLAMEGFEVMTASDGVEGMERTLSTLPDAALIDLGLPKLNGQEVARLLRRQLGDSIYLVALTGHGHADDIEAARRAGFDEHLVKPLNLEELLRLLKSRRVSAT